MKLPVFILFLLLGILALSSFIFVLVCIVKALLKYLKTKDVRQEQSKTKQTLGACLKQHRTRCKMTQEFVAESLGISRQAVSKWESGVSDPSTSNLIALAKLFGISAEELLQGIE